MCCYMVKIYTPAEWNRFFPGVPELVIRDGWIYPGDTNRQLFSPSPIGKIKDGLIYGENYSQTGALPVGKIKKEGNLIKIYGEDYYEDFAIPLFYIKDNRVYSAAEYNKFIPSPSAYVKETNRPKRVPSGGGRTAPSQKDRPQPPQPVNPALAALGWLLLIVFTIGLTGYGFFTGYFTNLSPLLLAGGIIGALGSLWMVSKAPSDPKAKGSSLGDLILMYVCALFIMGVAFLVFAYVSDVIFQGTILPWTLWEIILACVAAAASVIMASGIIFVCVFVVWAIKQLVRFLS